MKADELVGADAGGRIAGFDLLRGICALAVAIYHVSYWSGLPHIHNLGTYGVYAFFVLSGASMYVAYRGRFQMGYAPAKFVALRLIRLMPLYVLALTIVLAMPFIRQGVDVSRLGLAYLNVLFLFGLGNPGSTSQVVGGWSLGIEFVFYLLFPVALSLIDGKRWLLVLLVLFTSQHVFINTVFADGKTLAQAWTGYTQFLAFSFYFAAGCAIGRGVENGWIRAHWLGVPLLITSLVLVGAMNGHTAEETLIGPTGILFSLLTVVAVAASAAIHFGKAGRWFAEQLGRSSYGVYILHPLLVLPVSSAARKLDLSPHLVVFFTVATSVCLALLIERRFEAPMQRFLKKWLLPSKRDPGLASSDRRARLMEGGTGGGK